VIAYDKSLGKDMRLKVETYYQNIYKAPVTLRSSSYSLLNYGADFSNPSIDSLVNKGNGKNYGVELTLEKFFSRHYYFLTTGSLFNSKYSGSDQVERNSAFNGNYTVNFLAGKEFVIRQKNSLSFDFKATAAGGRRYIPINVEKTQDPVNNPKAIPIYDYDNAYKYKLKDYFRVDIKMTYRKNGNKIAQEWIIDIQNVFNIKNIFSQVYDSKTRAFRYEYQLGIFPVGQYKILF
jgi:outer membrane receptor protein involved in Fe transport